MITFIVFGYLKWMEYNPKAELRSGYLTVRP